MNTGNVIRELQKVSDVLAKANDHFQHESKMNAALHMAETVRLTPLGAAIENALGTVEQLIEDIRREPTDTAG